ncbi:MAG: ABC transporter permease, partial [Magnetococcales bacterium]|nr:ABC transporter permease [Magnetococcales bacterium]
LLGSGFAASFRAPGLEQISYLEYFYPGILLMLTLFASIFSTITIIEDRQQGLLQEILVAPVPRLCIVVGKVLGAMSVALVQTLLLLLVAPLLGLSPPVFQLLLIIAGLVVTALGFTALGFLIAWNMESSAGYHAIMSVFLMPLWMLSGALFPVDQAPAWLWWLMILNPVTHALMLIRMPFYHTDSLWLLFQDWHYLLAVGITLIWAVGCLVLALWRISRVEQGV